MTREQLRAGFANEQLKALKTLVDLAEQASAPEAPDVPDWEKSPDGLECLGEEKRTPAELLAIGIEWQAFAGKLHDMLEPLETALHAHEAEIAQLRAVAKVAQLALIELERGACSPAFDRNA